MRIEFGLLSILSLCALLFFGLQGDIDLYSWEVGIDISHDEVRVMVDPVWIAWANPRMYTGYSGLALGNVAIIEKTDRDTLWGDYTLVEEINHIKQFYALGLFVWPMRFLINIEPPKDVAADWNDPDQLNRIMWLPPPSWVNRWHFIIFLL